VRKALLFVLMASLIAASFTASTANAYYHATEPYLDPAYETQFVNLLDGTPPASAPPVPAWVAQDLQPVAQTAGRIIPFVKYTTAIALSATAFDFGWKIGRTIDTKFLHLQDPNCIIFGCPTLGADFETVKSRDHTPVDYLTTGNCGAPLCTTPVTYDSYQYYGAGSSGGTTYGTAGGCDANTYSGDRFANGSYTGGCVKDQAYWGTGGTFGDMGVGGTVWNHAIAAGWIPYVQGTNNGECGFPAGVGISGCKGLYKYDSAVTPLLQQQQPAPYVAQTTTATTNMATPPTTGMTGTQLATARSSIGTSTDTALHDAVNCLLAPADYTCPSSATATDGGSIVTSPSPTPLAMPAFVLPRPVVTETYSEYVDRLRALGYLGDITFLDDGMGYTDPSDATKLNPQTVTRVRVDTLGGTGTIKNLYNQTTGATLEWNDTAIPQVTPGTGTGTTTNINVYKVPDSWDPTAHGGDGSQGAIVPPSGGCVCPPIDLSPLTGTDVGDKFPFGVFVWLNDSIGTIPTSGTALAFSVTKPYGGTIAISTASSEWEDNIRPIVFPIVEFLMTLGMFYFFATKILGLGGD